MGIIKTYKFKISEGKEWISNVERYDSARDVVSDCKTRKITDRSFEDKSKQSFSSSWEGVNSYDEALTLLENGYQATVDKLQSSLKINQTGISNRVSFHNDIQGFAPIVPLAMKGVPNSMVNMTVRKMKVKVIDVYLDMGCSAGVSPESITKSGQKALSAIVALEKQGYRFNLYAVQTYNDHSSSDVLCVKVKDSGRTIDLKRMSFPLTHPAFFRVIGFDWYSRMPKAKYRCGYGKPLKYVLSKDEMKVFAKETFGPNAVYLSNQVILDKSDKEVQEVLINV